MDISSFCGGGSGRVQFLQAQLFPVYTLTPNLAGVGGRGFLGSFLSKSLKTNQLEVNTDEKTLRPIARLKEPRDLFALPKADRDHDCPQQAPRWPIECQVIEERIIHIPYVPKQPEPYNQPTGDELKPRPVGEENGIVVFNYNPISAVNYNKPKKSKRNESSDSDISSSESRGSTPECSTPDRRKLQLKNSFSKLLETLHPRSSSNSNDEYDDEDYDDDDDDDIDNDDGDGGAADVERENKLNEANAENGVNDRCKQGNGDETLDDGIDDIWADKSPEYMASTPTYIKSQFGKEIAPAPAPATRTQAELKILTKAVTPVSLETAKLTRLALVSKTNHNNNNNNNNKNNHKNRHNNKLSRSNSSSGSSCSSCLSSANNTDDDDDDDNDNDANVDDDNNNDGDDDDGRTLCANVSQIAQNALITNTTTTTTTTTAISIKLTHEENSESIGNNQLALSAQIQELTFGINRLKQNSRLISRNTSTCIHQDFTSDSILSQPQFSRSAVGGSKFLTNCHPYNADEYDGLEFESRFESGNLAKAIKITQTYYELYLRPDLYTSRSKQWFYFRVRKTRKNVIYRFSIVNLVKSDSLYNDGMRPLMYSTINAKQAEEGWRRCGENISYYRNDDENSSEDDEDNASYTLTFNIEFPNDDDTVFFAHSYPYTYSDLQDYLMEIQKHPVKSKFCKLRLLCRSLAGNNVYYLTVTAPTADEEAMKRKKSIVVSARVHPSETPASWMMKGLMDFITGESSVAKRLRHKFIFKLVPMLNPDGVIVGNTRNSLTGKDLNRQYRTVIRETYPSIWYTKAMLKRLIDECGVAMYCDMHAHSRKHNIFIYGCENKRNPEKKLTEQVFPLMMHKNVADKFSFESCKFKIQRSKEGTGRIVVWMLGITNSYTIEASFGGSSLGSRKGTHFTTADYEHMGRAFCETLLDYCDENPNKERLRLKIIERLLKEGSSADEPLNIPLSDYSSDEGDTSSSSDNEGKGSISFSDLEGPCCAPLKAPPCSPEVNANVRKFKYKRMRKIMFELDRIYFQPLFHKRYRALMKTKKLKHKRQKKVEGNECGKENDDFRQESQIDELNQSKSDINAEIVRKFSRSSHQKRTRRKAKKKKRLMQIELKSTNEKNQRIKVSRKLRLWLESRKIIITRRKNKHRKIKLRSKSSQARRKKDDPNQRTPLDLPTTDPGSDLHFSTDDEQQQECGDKSADIFNIIPRTRRILLQSDLQRRYIEEIGDGTARALIHMPPELVITSPSKQNTTKSIEISYKPPPPAAPTPRTAPDRGKSFLAEFPLIDSGPTRRTNSWHNLHNSAKCMPKIKVQNPYQMNDGNTNDDLHYRLSLKKKVWTGIQPDVTTTNYMERNRPLSWGVPLIGTQGRKEKVTVSTRTVLKTDEHEALLNACSQKLLAWQQQRSSTPINDNKKTTLNLVLPETSEEERTLRILKQLSLVKKSQKSPLKLDVSEMRIKKRKSSLTKIAETTQLITRLVKNKSRNGTQNMQHHHHHHTRPHKSASIMPLGSSLAQGNKFKTGGIVATAVQPSMRRSKKQRTAGKQLPAMDSVIVSSASATVGRNHKATGIGNTANNMDMHALSGSTFVRKVKTKLKKKKSSLAVTAITIKANRNHSTSGIVSGGSSTNCTSAAAGGCTPKSSS